MLYFEVAQEVFKSSVFCRVKWQYIYLVHALKVHFRHTDLGEGQLVLTTGAPVDTEGRNEENMCNNLGYLSHLVNITYPLTSNVIFTGNYHSKHVLLLCFYLQHAISHYHVTDSFKLPSCSCRRSAYTLCSFTGFLIALYRLTTIKRENNWNMNMCLEILPSSQ